MRERRFPDYFAKSARIPLPFPYPVSGNGVKKEDTLRCPPWGSALLLDEGSNFFGEIFLFLFDAFTQLITGKTGNFGIVCLQQLRDAHLVVADVDLVDQADFFVVLVDTAQDHLFDDVFRFPFVAGLFLQDFLFMVQFGSGNFGTVQVGRVGT